MTPDHIELYRALSPTEIALCLVAQQRAMQQILDDHAQQLAAIRARLEAQSQARPAPTPEAVAAYEAWLAQRAQP
jgi:hypothetical protein